MSTRVRVVVRGRQQPLTIHPVASVLRFLQFISGHVLRRVSRHAGMDVRGRAVHIWGGAILDGGDTGGGDRGRSRYVQWRHVAFLNSSEAELRLSSHHVSAE